MVIRVAFDFLVFSLVVVTGTVDHFAFMVASTREKRSAFKFVTSNNSPSPNAVGAVSWHPRRSHPLGAPNEPFAARTGIAVAVHAPRKAWLNLFC